MYANVLGKQKVILDVFAFFPQKSLFYVGAGSHKFWNVKLTLYKLNLSSSDSPLSATKKLPTNAENPRVSKGRKTSFSAKRVLANFSSSRTKAINISPRASALASVKNGQRPLKDEMGMAAMRCRKTAAFLKGNKGDGPGLGSCFSFYQQNPKFLSPGFLAIRTCKYHKNTIQASI